MPRSNRRSYLDDIADSALKILRTSGPRAVTVEAVAAQSGIAKTTIYRRHPNRRDMLSSALNRVASPPPLDPGATLADRLRWLITHAVGIVEDGIGPGGFAAMLTNDDPEFTTVFRQILIDQRTQLAAAIETAKADGAIRPDINTATLIDSVVGAYVAERARSGEVAHDWEQQVFDLLWPTIRA